MRVPLRVVMLATIASLSFSSIARAELACWHPNESDAAQMKELQSLLMVGTLQCRAADRTAIDSYNAFVAANRTTIDANIYALKAHFLRENGIGEGQRAYDEYSTAVANKMSSQVGDPAFCSTVKTLVDLAANASAVELMTLAKSVSSAPVSGHCPLGAEPAALAHAGPVEVATDRPRSPPEPLGASPQPAASAVPAAAIGPAPAKPTRDQAMAAAVTALQAATRALEAAAGVDGDIAPGVAEPKVDVVSLSKGEESRPW